MNSLKNKKGFTLIELLVVISIIALLMSVLLPALRKAKDQTRKVMCAVNQRTIFQLLTVYASNYKNYFPIPFAGWTYESMDLEVKKYVTPTMGVWWLDALRKSDVIKQNTQWEDRMDTTFQSCPAANPHAENVDSWSHNVKLGQGLSLGMNDGYANLIYPDRAPTANVPLGWWAQPISVSRIKQPYKTVLSADVRSYWPIYTWRSYGGPRLGGCFVFRHSGGTNFGMADGHTEFGLPESARQKDQLVCRPARFKYDYNTMPNP